MRFLRRNQPGLPPDLVTDLLDRHYGLEGHLTMLESERDQNFRVSTDADSYLFKVSNVEESPETIDLQIQALRHIERVDPTVPVPRALATVGGEGFATVTTSDGTSHVVRLMSFLDGAVADRPPYDTSEFRHNTGVELARLDRALRGFIHPGAQQDHPWDLMRVARLLDKVEHIPDERARRDVSAILEKAEKTTIPACLALRHQVIHQDAHTSNLVVDPGEPSEIVGIIDFGDMVHGPLIAEIAVAAHLSGRPDGAAETLIDIVVGYDSITPLEAAEVDVLYDLVLARLAMSTTIVAARAALFPDEDHHGSDQEFLWRRLRVAVESAEEVSNEMRRLLGLARPHGSDLASRRVSALGQHSPHFYKDYLHVVAGEGMWLQGADGRRYLDFYNNVPTVGHNHPEVVNAVSRQLATLNTNTRYLYPAVVEYAERLTSTLDHDLDVCLFVNSGSEANDVAGQILKHRSDTDRLLVIEGSYHGMTEAAFAITGDESSTAPNVTAIAHDEDFGRLPSSLAGLFVDPALTSNGVPSVSSSFFAEIAELARSRGGLVVADEVQAGFGRTGVMWGHDRVGLVPDLVTIGKPAGNGMPLGVVVTQREILEHFLETTGLFSTFGGNPVSSAAGLAVLDVIEREGLVENSAVVGDYLRERLTSLARSHELIGDVRGAGLLTGLELDVEGGATQRLIEMMRESGVLVGVAGRKRNVLKLRPPLVAQPDHVDRFVVALEKSMARL